MAKIRMTREMFEEYNAQLHEYHAQYEQVMRNLAQAKAEGDVSDNAAHDIAMRKKEELTTMINELMDIIENAAVVQDAIDTSVCNIFTYVTLEDTATGSKFTAQLVESGQGKPPIDGNIARISIDSQVGREIGGKPAGSVVSFLDGHLQNKILRIVSITEHKPKVTVQEE